MTATSIPACVRIAIIPAVYYRDTGKTSEKAQFVRILRNKAENLLPPEKTFDTLWRGGYNKLYGKTGHQFKDKGR